MLEASKVGIHDIDRHLRSIPGIGLAQHFQVNEWVLVAGETDVSNLAGLFGFDGCLDPPSFEHPIGIIVVVDFMELPQVQMVRLKAAKTVLQALHRPSVVALAVLGHEKHLVASSTLCQGFPHYLLAQATRIFPSRVEEGDPLVNRRVHHVDRRGLVFGSHRSHVSAAQAENRDLFARTPESSSRDAGRPRLLAKSTVSNCGCHCTTNRPAQQVSPGALLCHCCLLTYRHILQRLVIRCPAAYTR